MPLIVKQINSILSIGIPKLARSSTSPTLRHITNHFTFKHESSSRKPTKCALSVLDMLKRMSHHRETP